MYSRLALVTFVCTVLLSGISCRRDTLEARKAIANEVQTLVNRLGDNPKDTEALDRIREILRGDWPFARTYACAELKRLGREAAAATPELVAILQSDDGPSAREAALALGEVAVGREDVVDPLIAQLKKEDGDRAWFSARALGKIGSPALRAIPALEKAAQSNDEMMAEEASTALERLRALKSDQQ